MTESLQPFEDPQLRGLIAEEARLQERLQALDRRAVGLVDVDLTLRLAGLRLRVANRLLDGIDPAQAEGLRQERMEGARGRARAALRAVEALRGANVSLEQQEEVLRGEAYAETRTLFQEFVARGGGALLQPDEATERERTAVARAVSAALRKFSTTAADYRPALRAERLPRPLRRLVNALLPVLAPENAADPPYGIPAGSPEGQELLSSERMKMPLSQAIYYLETELLPRLEGELAADPGNPLLTRQLRVAGERLREYRGIRVLPRATPINLEHGFYTDWLTQYSADGELLVSINLPTRTRRGTNFDRLREMMQQEVVRRLAGRGIDEELDREYRFRRSLESGRRGSSRVPSQKLDFARCYRQLRARHPGLARLEDDRNLRSLLEAARAGRRAAEGSVRSLLAGPADTPLALP